MDARAQASGWAQLFSTAFGRSRNAMLLTAAAIAQVAPTETAS